MLELLFYIYFYFLVAIRGLGAFTATETPSLWNLWLWTPQCGTGQSQTLRRFNLELLKQFPENPSMTSLLWANFGPMTGLALGRVTAGIATSLFPCAVCDKDGFPSLSKAGEPFAPFRGCGLWKNVPKSWLMSPWIHILFITHMNSVSPGKPKWKFPSCAAPVTCTSKGAAHLLSPVNFFVWPLPFPAKLQSQRRFLLLRIMDVLTLKNNVALAGVKLLAGLT